MILSDNLKGLFLRPSHTLGGVQMLSRLLRLKFWGCFGERLFDRQLSSDRKPGYLVYVRDEILPSYMGVSLNGDTPKTPQNDHF